MAWRFPSFQFLISDKPPTVGQVLTAVDARSASWQDPGGGLQPVAGVPFTQKFAVAFDAAGLSDGIPIVFPVYTPRIGDLLENIQIITNQVWDGTTPQLDVGTFIGVSNGLFGGAYGALDMTKARAATDGTGIGQATGFGSGQGGADLLGQLILSFVNVPAEGGTGTSGVDLRPFTFDDLSPLKVCVSQDGTAGGTDPAATHGAATVLVTTITPAG